MNKIKRNWKKYWHIYVLVSVMLVAFFVRSWNFADTLYFRMDQARDASLIQAAFEGGIGELPLLGPRAAGSFLRMGPIFYYFQYISAIIFNSVEPQVLAFPDLFFSILTIPLFYYFLRNFFSKKNSLLAVVMFASSFVLTQYARFAWNPNTIIFWMLLTLLGAYKCTVQQNAKSAGKWLLIASLGYSVASQLHFTALLSLPIIILGFWSFSWPKQVKFKFWAGAIGILLFFYGTMLISETFTKGDNVNQFIYALSSKSEEAPLAVKLENSIRLHAKYYSLMLTSYGNLKSNAFIVFFLGIISFGSWRFSVLWRAGIKKRKKVFIVMIAVWFCVFAILYTKLSLTVLKPRFWLLIAPLPFILVALLFQWADSFRYQKLNKIGTFLLTVLIILANGYAIFYWYRSLSAQEVDLGRYTRDLQLKQSDLIGLKQMKTVAGDWVEISQQSGKTICYQSERGYLSPYEYVLNLYYPEKQIKRTKFTQDTNENCSFVSVRHGGTEGKNPIKKDHADEFEVIRRIEYKRMLVWELLQAEKEEVPITKEQTETETTIILKEVPEKAVLTKEVEEKIIEKPSRKERVFWKHVFGWEKYEM